MSSRRRKHKGESTRACTRYFAARQVRLWHERAIRKFFGGWAVP